MIKYGPEPSIMDMLDEEEVVTWQADDDETGAAEDGEENGEEKATEETPSRGWSNVEGLR